MPKYYPNFKTGEVVEAKKLWGKNKIDLYKEGYLVNFFKSNQYNGQEYFILRKKVRDYYQFEKVSRYGTTNKLPLFLIKGWTIVKAPEGVELRRD